MRATVDHSYAPDAYSALNSMDTVRCEAES
jgi:hypothetical protein